MPLNSEVIFILIVLAVICYILWRVQFMKFSRNDRSQRPTYNTKEVFVDNLVILKVKGAITLPHLGILRKALGEQVSHKRINIILDLSGVSYCDSSATSELIQGFAVVRDLGGRVAYVTNKALRRILEITAMGMLRKYLYNTVEEAVRSFDKDLSR